MACPPGPAHAPPTARAGCAHELPAPAGAALRPQSGPPLSVWLLNGALSHFAQPPAPQPAPATSSGDTTSAMKAAAWCALHAQAATSAVSLAIAVQRLHVGRQSRCFGPTSPQRTRRTAPVLTAVMHLPFGVGVPGVTNVFTD